MDTDRESMRPGARNAVQVCMATRPADRVFILTDDETLAVGDILAEESRAITPHVTVRRLEEFGTRPLGDVPPVMFEAIRGFQPTVFFYAAQGKPGEIGFRIQLRPTLLGEIPMRWGHMIGITPQLMREGMREDYHRIAAVTQQVNDRVKTARQMRITSPKGTDVTATFSPDLRWRPCPGLYHHAGEWGNLPEGETFTCPESVDGVLVAEVLGDYFSAKYGVLSATPVTFNLQNGFVTGVTCANQAIAGEVWEYLNSAENGTRAGEFAIGTNIGLTRLTGNLLQDEKIPGIHVAFGNPYPHETGARWQSKIHVDVIPVAVTIVVDGATLFDRDGFHL